METGHPVAVIETLADLEQLAAHLAGVDRVAIDLESDSFCSYHERRDRRQRVQNEDFRLRPRRANNRRLAPSAPLFLTL